MGWFQAGDGRSVFVLRSKQPSLIVPTKGEFDFVLSKEAYDRLLECKER